MPVPTPTDADSEPSHRGATLISREREDCEWPCVKEHSLRLIWDKREDRMVARIITKRGAD